MLIDSHCHLVTELSTKTPEQLVNEAVADGVTKLIDIGTSVKENLTAIKNAELFESVYASIGIYPHEEIGKSLDVLHKSLDDQLKLSKKIVAIGECGMDITDRPDGRKVADQIEVFEMQVQFAINHKLPLIVHNRNGDADIVFLLRKYRDQGITGVIHCFSTTWAMAQEFLNLGFYLSFAGMITYPSRKDLLETVQKVPNDKFIIETDSPYLPPQGHRGEINEPKYVKIVAEKVSEVKQITLEEVSTLSYANTCKLFNI